MRIPIVVHLVLALAAAATLACGNDASATPAPVTDGPSDASDFGSDDGGEDARSPDLVEGGPALQLSASSVDFSTVACGSAAATSTLTLRNAGGAPVSVSATTSGDAFTVSPAVLTLNTGASATLTIAATVPTSATAGVPIAGSLNLSTGSAERASIAVPLSVIPSGASLAFAQGQPSTFAFPLSEVGYPGSLAITLVNAGNAPAIFTVGSPSDARFSLLADAGAPLAAGATWDMAVDFTADDTTTVRATAVVGAAGPTCAASLQAITFSGRGTTGEIAGWPATVDFGPSDCGGSAPAERSFTLTNSAAVDAHLTVVAWSGAPGFTTNAEVGRTLFAGGGSLDITVNAPPVPALTSSGPITATLTIQTDADDAPSEITLTEEPNGAVLAFDASTAPSFGSFGEVPLLDSAQQSFHVVNLGTGAASITLTSTRSPAFSVSNATFTLYGNGSQAETATFAPTSGGATTGSISMTATGALCAPLPAPIPLSGTSGPVPNVTPTSLSFAATCGGGAPAAQAFFVENGGNANMTWSMGDVTGAGAAGYTLSASPPPGLLIPGASAIVTVSAASIASPAASTDPSAFAAQVMITTDVPLDPPHVVTLGETPLGDQLSFSFTGPLRFGQVPIGAVLSQPIGVTNAANVGSVPAAISFVVQGSGAGAYAVTPSLASNLAPGGDTSSGEGVAFAPTDAIAYPATLSLTTTDHLCSPLPAPVQLSAAGTEAEVALSATTLTFGTDPTDPDGLVDCGGTGLAQVLTVSNVGNQSFDVTELTLGTGASSPYALSGSSMALPASVAIGGSASFVVTPLAIPSTVANPSDPSPFTDTLTVTTDAALDVPHAVRLVMQARGAVIADTPLSTAWTFGEASPGAIATLTTVLENTGNGGVSIALRGLSQPSIFGLQNNPTAGVASGNTSIVGQFVPPSSSGSWTDQGTLSVTALTGFCAPLPSQWTNPAIQLSGHSP